MKLHFVPSLAVAWILIVAPAIADDLSAGQMLQSLQPKKSATRSFKVGSSASTEDQMFIDSLKGQTRAIVVQERQKLSAVVQKYDMPQIDLEIYFDFNSAAIAQPALPTLIKLGQALSDPSLAGQSIIISGHTDAVGSDTFNLDLSEARAWSVRQFLVDNFMLDPRRIIAVGFGEEELKNPYVPESGENRRVAIINIVM